MISIVPAEPGRPDIARLLHKSHALMESMFPSEENHYLSIEELGAPHISFFAAEIDGQAIGTGALSCQDGYGEVKSLFVDDAMRGRGVAEMLMRQIEARARACGIEVLYLETGNKLNAALRLYGRLGFDLCGPFGAYRENATSLFMKKDLT